MGSIFWHHQKMEVFSELSPGCNAWYMKCHTWNGRTDEHLVKQVSKSVTINQLLMKDFSNILPIAKHERQRNFCHIVAKRLRFINGTGNIWFTSSWSISKKDASYQFHEFIIYQIGNVVVLYRFASSRTRGFLQLEENFNIGTRCLTRWKQRIPAIRCTMFVPCCG